MAAVGIRLGLAVDKAARLRMGDAGDAAFVAVVELELGPEIGATRVQPHDLKHVVGPIFAAVDQPVPEMMVVTSRDRRRVESGGAGGGRREADTKEQDRLSHVRFASSTKSTSRRSGPIAVQTISTTAVTPATRASAKP